jgi:hypothetical protein
MSSQHGFKRGGLESPSGPHSEQCAGDCAGERAGLPLRASYGLTPVEDIALDLVRLLLSAQVTGEARYWFAAMDYAEVNLGSLPASTLCVHVTALVRTVRRDRQVPFSFLSFGCRHICDDEVALVSLLQAMQLGCQADLDDALDHVTQGGPVHALRACAAVLAERMRVIEASVVERPPQRRSHVPRVDRALH